MALTHLFHMFRGWAGWRLTPVAELHPFPLALYRARPGATRRDTLAIFVSGDGGWGRMGTNVARVLSEAGVSVVGLDSTRYFWNARSSEEAARDLTRIAAHFQEAWGLRRTIILGYSFGADVLPRILADLSPSQHESLGIRRLVLLSVGDRVELQFRFVGWLGHETPPGRGEDLAPFMRQLVAGGLPVTAFRGVKETRGLETEREVTDIRILPGGHFYGGHYVRLAGEVLSVVCED